MFAKRVSDDVSSFQVKRCDIQFVEILPAFTLDNILRSVTKERGDIQAADRLALAEALNNNTACLEFARYLQQIIEIEKSKESGLGLTDKEKSHYNELTQLIVDSRPNQTDQLSEMRQKVKVIRENNLLKSNYSNILKLYKAYLGVVNSDVMLTEGMADLAKEWQLQKYFAAADVNELLALYRVYLSAERTIANFSQLCLSDQVQLSLQMKHAILAYCGLLTAHIRQRQLYALESMLFRIELVEKKLDIHYDDVIYYFINHIEIKLQRRVIKEDETKQAVFDQLRRRKRRGMTDETLREMMRELQGYITSPSKEAEDDVKKAEFKRRLERLKLSEVPEGLVQTVKPEVATDPVILFLYHHFDACCVKVKESLLLETDEAICRLNDLDWMLSEAMRLTSAKRLYTWWPLAQADEVIFARYQKSFSQLLNHVYDFLSMQLRYNAIQILKNAESGQVLGMAEWQHLRNILWEFHKKYASQLGQKPIELATDFLVPVVSYLYENDSTLSSSKFCEALAVNVTQYVYWPMMNERMAEYDATKRAILRALRLLENKRIKGSLFLNRYINYNWLLYFFETVLPPHEMMLKQREQIAASFGHSWKTVFPLEEVICKDKFVYYIPSHIRPDLSVTASNNPKSQRRRFLLSVEELVKKIHLASMYLVNVVIPHVKYSPFISLINLSRGDRFVSNLDELIHLNSLLCEDIAETLRNRTISKETVYLLEKLLAYSNSELAAINHAWQEAILENIHANFDQAELCAYLRHPDFMINLDHLQKLYAKIEELFNYPNYKSVLFEKINKVCVGILVEEGKIALSKPIDSDEFHRFISIVTELSFVGSNGEAIIKSLMSNEGMQAKISAHISQFDGSREEIGSLIAVFCPPSAMVGSGNISRYIIPYATKRLEYLRSQQGKGIRLSDIMFFDSYNTLPAVSELFNQHREYYEREIISAIRQKENINWNSVAARIVELFGSKSDRQFYRAVCLVNLLKKDKPNDDDQYTYTAFKATIYHQDQHLIDPGMQLPGVGIAFETFLDQYVDVLPWSELRDRVIMLFGPVKSQYYHERCLYQFLNNNIPGYGEWLNIVLNEIHPFDYFGKESVKKIVEHVISMITVASEAARDFNMTERQSEGVMSLLYNLRYMKILFERIGDLTGYQVVSEIGSLERTLRLATLTKRLLGMICDADGDVAFSDDAIGKLLYQIHTLFLEVDSQALVSLVNVRQYLVFLDGVITHVRTVNLDQIRERYLHELFSFYSHFINHLKQVLLSLAKLDILPDSDKQYLQLTINCLDSNDKIDARRQEVLDGFDQSVDLKDVADATMQLAVRVNNKIAIISKAVDQRSLAEAGVKHSLENPLHYSLICLKKIAGIDLASSFSQPIYHYLVAVTRRELGNIELHQFSGLVQGCAPVIEKLEAMGRVANAKSSLVKQSIYASSAPVRVTPIAPLLEELHHKYIASYCYRKIVDYVSSKIEVRLKGDPLTFFGLFSQQLAAKPEKERLSTIKEQLHIDKDYNARKVDCMLEVSRWMAQFFNGLMKKNELQERLEKLLMDIAVKERESRGEYYKSKEFSQLFAAILELVKTDSLSVLLQQTSSLRMNFKF